MYAFLNLNIAGSIQMAVYILGNLMSMSLMKKGNWTKKIQFRDEMPDYIIEREYIYY